MVYGAVVDSILSTTTMVYGYVWYIYNKGLLCVVCYQGEYLRPFIACRFDYCIV